MYRRPHIPVQGQTTKFLTDWDGPGVANYQRPILGVQQKYSAQQDCTYFYIQWCQFPLEYQYLHVRTDDFLLLLFLLCHLYINTVYQIQRACIPSTDKEKQTTLQCLSTSLFLNVFIFFNFFYNFISFLCFSFLFFTQVNNLRILLKKRIMMTTFIKYSDSSYTEPLFVLRHCHSF